MRDDPGLTAWLGSGITALACLTIACGQSPARSEATSAPASQTAPAAESYVPGLGEIMSLQQMRHTKLWFAGAAKNWKLADYELDELGEGFDDVVKMHPTHKDSPVAPKDVVPKMMNPPLETLRKAVAAQDSAAFAAAFDALTAGCNTCHEATNFGFNRVQRPMTNSYSNQVF
jgi:hypothetical protein